jgi:hypothetical protein
MKVSVKKETHTGEQPIRVLKHNLTTRLVERNEEYIKSLHSDFKLDSNIKYHIANLPLVERQTPFLDSNGMINLHETYLSYIWIVSYYFFVLHEEELAIPDCIKRNLPVPKPHNPELTIPKARELFDYGKSLIKVFSSWDKDNLPNPEYFDEETDEGWYILRTNDLYVEVLNVILYHETAHAEFEHIKKITKEKLTTEERKSLELDADTRAIELILSSGRNRNASELAIIIGLASMLFFNNSLDGGKKHPNIDTRLENAIRIFKPLEDSSIWPFLALFLKVWSDQFELGLTNKEVYNNYKELFYDLLSQIN